jgi:hypothetical protein
MRDARDPDALITAEDALSERQAELDSLRAQREALGDQVAYSTVDVSFFAERVGGPAPKQYDGFIGQVQRGWDAMVSVAGGAILLFGLLLPWMGVVLIAGGIGYGIVWWARRGTAPVATQMLQTTDDPPAQAEESSDELGDKGIQ